MTTGKNVKIVTVAGTRPESIKLSKFIQEISKRIPDDHCFLYTGQHYSNNMKDIFFDELAIKPDYDLRCNTSDVEILKNQILKLFNQINPKYIIVYGDTYSSLAGTLAAEKMKSTLIHLEAGIRDLDVTVPEERVRLHIDSVSDYLMAPTELAKTFLSYEGITNNVVVTGNLIVDVCKEMVKFSENHKVKDLPTKYLLLTMHRPENVDDPEKLELLRKHLSSINYKVLFPIHPRTRNNLSKYGISLPDNVVTMEPTGYLEFLYLLKNCELVMTDSGGVTEEAIILKKPCITLRHTTARWETILLKANILFPLDRKDPLSNVIEDMIGLDIKANPYGDNVAKKTVDLISKII